ncbi:unnamed protein product [marine sediment metagenome]|uniref:Uncharacterized protein n=1 Tax=marine sediment metagenome TaxID=412755 RepID=X1GPY7_9ZZZZ
MSNWGDDSVYGQARKEGGIVDMFMNDTVGEDKRQAKKLAKKNKNKLFTKQSIKYCPNCGKALPNMKPR